MTTPTTPSDDLDAAACNAALGSPPPTDEEVERVARIIDPSSWRVLDAYLERVKRHHPHGGYDPDNFKDRASIAKARAILAPEGGASKLISGLNEAVDIAQGRAEPARVRTIAVTQDAPKAPTQGDPNDH